MRDEEPALQKRMGNLDYEHEMTPKGSAFPSQKTRTTQSKAAAGGLREGSAQGVLWRGFFGNLFLKVELVPNL
jgi:hypothetical protein